MVPHSTHVYFLKVNICVEWCVGIRMVTAMVITHVLADSVVCVLCTSATITRSHHTRG